MKKLTKNRKAQLFIIEAFIAVSVMIIMVTALYEVQIATQPPIVPSYHEEVYTSLQSLDSINILDEYIYAVLNSISENITYYRNVIEEGIYGSLPDNGEFNLYYENMTSGLEFTGSWINSHLTPPPEAIGIDYLIAEVNGELIPCTIHMRVWLKGV
jgi:hypothetical protein